MNLAIHILLLVDCNWSNSEAGDGDSRDIGSYGSREDCLAAALVQLNSDPSIVGVTFNALNAQGCDVLKYTTHLNPNTLPFTADACLFEGKYN